MPAGEQVMPGERVAFCGVEGETPWCALSCPQILVWETCLCPCHLAQASRTVVSRGLVAWDTVYCGGWPTLGMPHGWLWMQVVPLTLYREILLPSRVLSWGHVRVHSAWSPRWSPFCFPICSPLFSLWLTQAAQARPKQFLWPGLAPSAPLAPPQRGAHRAPQLRWLPPLSSPTPVAVLNLDVCSQSGRQAGWAQGFGMCLCHLPVAPGSHQYPKCPLEPVV